MRSLFNRWRTPRNEVEPLYTALVAEARRPAWYIEGAVADTLDGRFAVLSSLVAQGEGGGASHGVFTATT